MWEADREHHGCSLQYILKLAVACLILSALKVEPARAQPREAASLVAEPVSLASNPLLDIGTANAPLPAFLPVTETPVRASLSNESRPAQLPSFAVSFAAAPQSAPREVDRPPQILPPASFSVPASNPTAEIPPDAASLDLEPSPTNGFPAPDMQTAPTPRATVPPRSPPPSATSGEDMDGGAQEGDLRLVGRVDVNGFATGGVQVFRSGGFGAVCAQDFGNRDARVACRQLGFVSGRVLPSAFSFFGGETISVADPASLSQSEPFLAPFVLTALGCTGEEERLVDCPLAREEDYSESRVSICASISIERPIRHVPSFAAVACGVGTEAEEGDLRLSDGITAEDGSAQFGRLEFYSAGGWGTVCNLQNLDFGADPEPLVPFTDASAVIACRQLGFSDGVPAGPTRERSRGSLGSVGERVGSILRRVPIVRPGAVCQGTEAMLAECPLPRVPQDGVGTVNTGTPLCSHGDDVLLTCFNGPSDRDGSLRLSKGAAGPDFEYGRLEVFVNGLWSDICSDTQFTPNSAELACRLLGYDGGSRLLFTIPYADFISARNTNLYTVFPESRPVALAEVNCAGNETSLLDCPSQTSPGRVVFKAQCANSTDATILACGNTEPECDIELPEEEGSVRLVDGLGTPCDPLYTGTVEIFHAGEWGTICVSVGAQRVPIDLLAADTVCRQLGFPHGTIVSSLDPRADVIIDYGYNYPFDTDVAYLVESEVSSRVWLNELECFGVEEKVLDCILSPPQFVTSTVRNCPDSRSKYETYDYDGQNIRLEVACRQFAVEEAAESIVTPEAVEGAMRLVSQATVGAWVTGSPEIFFDGSWRQICAPLSPEGVAVACRQLGLGAASIPSRIPSDPEGLTFTPGGINGDSTPFVEPGALLFGSHCNGFEDSLLECTDTRRRSGFERCRGRTVSVVCVSAAGPGEEEDVRLGAPVFEIEGGMAGTLEIFHADAWGSVCSNVLLRRSSTDTVGASLGRVACRQLGFQDGLTRPIFSTARGQPIAPAWAREVSCNGTEAKISECQRAALGVTACRPPGAIRLLCSNADIEDGRVRLGGGAADQGGAWEYGRLEGSQNGLWVPEVDTFQNRVSTTDAVEACMALGYTSGAQMLGNELSALPGDGLFAVSRVDPLRIASLICSNPTGCQSQDSAPPVEGDVRLIPVAATGVTTAACDQAHFGGVEVFAGGRWARVCNGGQNDGNVYHAVVAQVVCHQLGYPFGGIMDADDDLSMPNEGTTDSMPAPVAANFVRCSGTEKRITDCIFQTDERADFVPLDELEELLGRPASGLCDVDRRAMLTVVCRQFPILGSDVIR